MLAKEFKTSVLPLSSKLLRFAIQFTKNEEEARDIIQDVFLKLWQKRHSLEKVENIEAFAMRMTRNKCLDMYRAKRSFPAEEEEIKRHKEEQQDLQQEVELSETAIILRNLIDKLPDLQQTVMRMRDIEQLEYDEIAERTELNINAIRVNLSRARKKVRDEFLKTQAYGLEGHQTKAARLF
ncbi:RNA polymerase sigma factor [Sunxiuqinia sp. A32]|uniref:RNA polymerase sigma factor n=1 Tax=Sunxiuqinia sp. A32 TaxID=3461496 RepID=UPI004045ADC4